MKMIPKHKLKNCYYYVGESRNAYIAQWDGKKEKFIYIRYKFGNMIDEIEHFEDVKEQNFDGFIPIREIKPPNSKKVNKLKLKIGYYD